MSVDNGKGTWALVLAPTLIFLVLILVINAVLGLGEVSNAFKRFANAFLTAYTLTAGALFGAMFFYADSRNRPLAPLFGMLTATLVGAGIIFLFLSQSDLLMEQSSSMQAQFFSNIVHLAVVFLALVTAAGLLVGITMAHITGNPPRRLPWPVEVEDEVEVVVEIDSEE